MATEKRSICLERSFVLESFYEVSRQNIATSMRSLLARNSVVVVDAALLLRSIEIYEHDRLDYAEAYLVACAESSGIDAVASTQWHRLGQHGPTGRAVEFRSSNALPSYIGSQVQADGPSSSPRFRSLSF